MTKFWALIAAASWGLAGAGLAEPLHAATPVEVDFDCRLSADRRVDDCKVIREDPAGLGLAAMRRPLIENPNYRVPENLARGAIAGRIRLRIPGGMTPEPPWSKATPPLPPNVVDLYRLRVSGGFYGGDYQSIAIRRITAAEGDFWAVEQRKRMTAGAHGPTIRIERRWVDGRNCPALSQIVESIKTVYPPPAPRGAGTIAGLPTIPPFQGNSTYLGTLNPDGRYDVRSDYEGPITLWWRSAEQKLGDCWGYMRKIVDGAEFPLTLESDADEAPYVALEASK